MKAFWWLLLTINVAQLPLMHGTRGTTANWELFRQFATGACYVALFLSVAMLIYYYSKEAAETDQ